MKRLIIVGAGNVGGYIAYNASSFGAYELIGFLDDDREKFGKTIYGLPVLGAVRDISNFSGGDSLAVAITISSPKVKARIVEDLSVLPLEFPNFVSDKAWISKGVVLGKGIILYPGTCINYESHVGDFVLMNMNCAIGHNCAIGSCASLAPGVNLGGFTVIEEQASLGIGSSTRQGVRVGRAAVVGGQAMLINDVKPGALIVGVPGRQIPNSH